MPQFIAVAVSVFVSFYIAALVSYGDASHHVRVQVPPATNANPQGVSGGGPVGIGPIAIPTPPPTNADH